MRHDDPLRRFRRHTEYIPPRPRLEQIEREVRMRVNQCLQRDSAPLQFIQVRLLLRRRDRRGTRCGLFGVEPGMHTLLERVGDVPHVLVRDVRVVVEYDLRRGAQDLGQ